MEGRSEKLAKERLRGDRDRFVVGKRIGSGVRKVAHDLEGMCGASGLLHRRKRARHVRVGCLRLHEKPGRAVFRDEKVHLHLRLVPHIVERIVAKPEIVPHVDRLEQMARDKVLVTRPFVRHFAPVALVPLWRLAYRILDIPEPRADGEALVKILECGYPRLDCRLGNAYFAGKRCSDDLVPGAGEEKLRQDSDSRDIGNLRKVAQIFAEELFTPELAPTMGESNVSPDKRFGEAAMRPERIPVCGLDGTWRMNFCSFKFRADKFRNAKRVHVVEEVPPHQAVAAALVDVKPRAAGDDKAHAVFVEIEEPLEKRLPADELVDFIERDDGSAIRCDAKSGGIGKPCRITRDELASGEVVPREVPVRECLGKRSLSALTGTSEKRHLAVVTQMLVKDGFVDTLLLECAIHGEDDTRNGPSRQYQTSGNARMAITKLVEALEWSLWLDPVGACVPRVRTVGSRVPRARMGGSRPVATVVCHLPRAHHLNNLNRRVVPVFQKHGRRVRPLSSDVNET